MSETVCSARIVQGLATGDTALRMDAVELRRLVGENLKRLMKEQGITVARLAEMVETSPGYLSEVRGGRGMGDDLLARLCTSLHVSPSEFFRPIRGLGWSMGKPEFRYVEVPPGSVEFIVPDDSMSPRYLPGQTLYVSKDVQVRSGDYVVIAVGGRPGLVLRQIFFTETKAVILRAISPEVPPVIIEHSDMEQAARVVLARELS